MRFFATVFLLSTYSSAAIAQTLAETEAWIIEQTKVNPYQLKHSIVGDELISITTVGSDMITGGPVQKAIPISQVTTIAYTHTNEYLSYTMTRDNPCAYLLDEPEELRPKFLFEIYTKLDASYVPRMNKALQHLIKLHGGKSKVVKAAAVKEVF